jgi:hypothetical protein
MVKKSAARTFGTEVVNRADRRATFVASGLKFRGACMMESTKRSNGGGAVRGVSHGGGSVGQTAIFRRPGGVPEQPQAVLYAEPREVLDGEVTPRLVGFDAETNATESRLLFVPFAATTCPAVALMACREQGLLKEKLDRMDPEAAHALYLTTLATPIQPS